MIIFMFVAINFIVQAVEHSFVQDDIYNTLKVEFDSEIDRGEIELGPDGSIRFTSPERDNLFQLNSDRLTPEFKASLQKVMPRYWAILGSDSTYLEHVKEIRIEGHADTHPPLDGSDSYIFNLDLSSRRAASVLAFLRQLPFYRESDLEKRIRMDFLFTSMGFSYSRALNSAGRYVYVDSDKTVNDDLSRRVEIRIVTSNEQIIQQIKQIDQ
jgi:outer membrane protein OmpA-like peptidoglycan-associated protein